MSGEGREFAINLALSLVLHFLVFAGVFLTPSLYSHQFQVPVAYKVTLVELPGTRRATPSRKQTSAVKPQPPKAPVQVAPKEKAKAKTSSAKPSSPEKLALPKKRKAARKRPKASAPAATKSSSTPRAVAKAPTASAVPAGPGDGGLPGVVSDSSVATESADPSLSYYLAAIQAKVSGRWVEPSLGLKLGQAERVTLSFTVLRSGLVRDIQVLTPSGNVFLDQSALRAVQEAVPLPPFPPLFAEETLLVRFHFEMRGQ
ncbi:MAG: TonB family protein [Candidatus Methylomirabilales bacterium]